MSAFSKQYSGIEVMKPLYPPEGSPVRGYGCEYCGAVTKTKRGMWTHLRVVHKIMRQGKLWAESEAK